MPTEYEVYLQTKHWQETRRSHLSTHKKCFVCGTHHRLQVHHCSYNNIGNEKPEDLVVLCSNHYGILYKRVNNGKLFLENAHFTLRKQYRSKRNHKKISKGHKKQELQKIKSTKVDKELYEISRHVLLGYTSIRRADLYNELTNHIGTDRIHEIKHAVINMIKRGRIVTLDNDLLCINPHWIHNKSYRR